MRLLALSDIHNNLVAVRKMRAAEKNSFDAIIVAGDIGNACAIEFFKIVSTFKCPIMYVLGNWDYELSYQKSYGRDCHLIHLNIFTFGAYSFTGFSGCPTHWGKNPIAHANVDALERNRKSLGDLVRREGVDPRRCIVVTHERLGHLRREIQSTLLHVFGHIHQFSDHAFLGTRYVNVAALDRQISARPRRKRKWRDLDCRNYNAGNYAIIEIDSSHDVTVKCVPLRHNYDDWIPLTDHRFNGIDWIPEEQKWTKRSDRPLHKFLVRRTKDTTPTQSSPAALKSHHKPRG